MNRRSALFLIASNWITVLGSIIATDRLEAHQPKHPNVILVLTDDQGFGDIQSHGNPYVQTPHQDALAASGVRFDRFYVSPVCAPTRASLLTGRYHLKTGVSGVTRGYENLRSEETTLAELFREAGYRTGCFGKWHNGRHMPMHPNGQGFETFFGFCGGHWNTYFNPPLELNGKPVKTEGYIADVITDAAVEFVQKNTKTPWFCYVALNTPHSPWRVPEKYWQNFEGLGLDVKAQCAYAMVENIDENLGRMLAAIKETGQENETVVLFLTDNGANSPRFNAGMKGRKGSVDEGGTRVPLFMRYPGIIPENKFIKPITFHLDILPTLAEICQIPLSADHAAKLDGKSLVPLIMNNRAEVEWDERMLFTETFRAERGPEAMKAAVRTDRWRATKVKGRWQLFDMINDPGQTENVALQNSQVVKNLSDAFDDWFASIEFDGLTDIAIPVGHSARTEFQLPANEAALFPGYGEGIKYTGDTPNGFANSWITEWSSVDAYPKWSLNVLNSGSYKCFIEYTCNPEDVGCQLEISIANQRKISTVSQSHVAPLQDKPDRLFSNNYQDKVSWATLVVGDFELPKGETSLIIRLKDLSGGKGIDLKSVILKRQK